MIMSHYFFNWLIFKAKAEIQKNIFIGFLVQMKTFKSTFEIYWPLIIKFYTNKAHHYIDTHSKILVAPN